MSRIAPLTRQESSLFVRFAGWLMRRESGPESNTAEFLGHHPGVLRSFLAFFATYGGWKQIPARLKRLVHLRVAMRVGCPS